MKKVISLGLISVLVLSMLLLFAGCGAKGSEGLEYKSNGDGTCAVIGMGTCTDTDLVIPKKSPDGDKVTSIADEAFHNSKIHSLKISDSVTEIGRNAFDYCTRLETVDLGKSLVKLGYQAFYGCDLITEVKLPDSFAEFGKGIGSNDEEFAGSGAFKGCSKLSKINIPKNVKAIYYDTFEGTALKEVTVDAQFKYGTVDFLFGLNTLEAPHLYNPSLLTEMPADDSVSYLRPKDTVEISDSIFNLLCAALFGENALVNGEPILVPAPLATVGDYGKADADEYDYVYSITSSSEIRRLHWDDNRGSYTTYDSDDIFNYRFDEKRNCYVFEDDWGEEKGFVVLDKYLFMSRETGHYELDKGYKE